MAATCPSTSAPSSWSTATQASQMKRKCVLHDAPHHHNNHDHHQLDHHNATTSLLTATSTSTQTTQRHLRNTTARPQTPTAHDPAAPKARPALQAHQSSLSYHHLGAPRHTSRATPLAAEQLGRTPPTQTPTAPAPQDHRSHQHLSLSRCSHHRNDVTATGHAARTSHASRAKPRLQHHHRRRHHITTVTAREHPTTSQADVRQQLSRLSHQRSQHRSNLSQAS